MGLYHTSSTTTSTTTPILLWWTGEEINGFRRGTLEINGRNNAALISDPLHTCWGAPSFKDINRQLTDEAIYYTDPDWEEVWDLSSDGTFVAWVRGEKKEFYWRGTKYSSSERYKIFRAYNGAEIDGPENGFVHVCREWDRENDPKKYRPNIPVQSIEAIDEEGRYFLIYKGLIYGPFERDFWNDNDRDKPIVLDGDELM